MRRLLRMLWSIIGRCTSLTSTTAGMVIQKFDVLFEEHKNAKYMVELTAYYMVREKLKDLLEEHKNAKYIVTEHSIGGALAILFPIVLVLHDETKLIQTLLGVYTFWTAKGL